MCNPGVKPRDHLSELVESKPVSSQLNLRLEYRDADAEIKAPSTVPVEVGIVLTKLTETKPVLELKIPAEKVLQAVVETNAN